MFARMLMRSAPIDIESSNEFQPQPTWQRPIVRYVIQSNILALAEQQ